MIYPIFVGPGKNVRKEISSMPGQFNLSVDRAVEVAREAEILELAAFCSLVYRFTRMRPDPMPAMNRALFKMH